MNSKGRQGPTYETMVQVIDLVDSLRFDKIQCVFALQDLQENPMQSFF